ncbi:MAG: TetR family transcriptional regulator [Actinobacteria bacterium]|nr:TetR family transcriptional regulator [Actinomycetota bacterium]
MLSGYPFCVPLNPRRRSQASVDNDNRILDAALVEVCAVGIDRIVLRSVARRVNLTSGAMYGRYESAAEIAVGLWTNRLAEPTLSLLSGGLESMMTGDSESMTNVVKKLVKPSPTIAAGLECLAVAHRHDVLNEEMSDWMPKWFAANGLDESTPHDERVRRLTALSVLLGMGLFSFVNQRPDEWSLIVPIYSQALRTPVDIRTARSTLEVTPFVAATTGDPLRDALINATAEVMGRAGLEQTTVSRIARRAHLTSGAVYTQYDVKEELLIDAMKTLLTNAAADTGAITTSGIAANDLPDATAQIYQLAVAPERINWRRFRLETYIAARTRPAVKRALRAIQQASDDRYAEMFGAGGTFPAAVVPLVSAAGQAIPIGFTVMDSFTTKLDTLDFRIVTRPLITMISIKH